MGIVLIYSYRYRKCYGRLYDMSYSTLLWVQLTLRCPVSCICVHETHITTHTTSQSNIPQCPNLLQKRAHVCTFLLQNVALCDIELVHCGICATSNYHQDQVIGRGDFLIKVKFVPLYTAEISSMFSDAVYRAIESEVGCHNVWAYSQCSGCAPLGEIYCETGLWVNRFHHICPALCI